MAALNNEPAKTTKATETMDHDARLIEGDGTPEAAWQAWPVLQSLPRLPLQSWLPRGVRLVVVAPHPDDEVLACGGLLNSHVAQGGACLVVAVTDGEASHAGSPLWTPPALARARRAESLDGLHQLGIRREDVARLGLPDGRVQSHAAKLVAALHLILRPTDVVVSTWRFDGHPDHEATGHAVATVCVRMGCRFMEAPVWMWHWAKPQSFHVPWRRLQGFALSTEAVAAKRRALAKHATQLNPREGAKGLEAPVLEQAILDRAGRDTEFFFT